MKEKREAGEYKEFTKKEQLLLDREIAKLERFFGGLAGLEDLPAALFIVDVRKEWSAAKEAQRRNVKVIAMTDTNANPDLVDYIIPANDDAAKAVELIVGAIGEAVEEGKRQEHKENQENQENQVRKAEKKRGRPKKTAEE